MDPATGINKVCRLCGRRFQGSGSLAVKFRTFLANVFDLDISQDDPAVHPKLICSSCYTRISRHRKISSKPELRRGIKEKFPTPYQFTGCSQGSDSLAKASILEASSTSTASPSKSSVSRKALSTDDPQILLLPGVSGSTKSNMETGCDSSAKASILDTPSTSTAGSLPMTDPKVLPNVAGSTKLIKFAGAKYIMIIKNQADKASTSKTSEGMRGLKRKLSVDSPVPEDVSLQSAITSESVQLDFFLDQNLARLFVCSVCQGVPTQPCALQCAHIFCKLCLRKWLKSRSSCPTCQEACKVSDMAGLTGMQLVFFNSLTLSCPNHRNGCTATMKVTSWLEHLSACTLTKVGRGKGQYKTSLSDKKLSYIRHQRLPQVIQAADNVIDKFCKDTYEDKTDVHFALLINYLERMQDHERATQIWKVWKGETLETVTLTPDQCLAIRVDNLQLKTQYKNQFDFLQTHLKDQNPFQTPSSVTKCEQKYMPGHVQYAIEGQHDDDSFHHAPEQTPRKIRTSSKELIDITEDFPPSTPELVSPNVVRGCYMDAIAHTLAELNSEIDSNLEKTGFDKSKSDMLFKTYIKDGADGLSDVSIYRQVSDRSLPDKAFRASFCVVKIEMIQGDLPAVTVFEDSEPDSIRANRPILEAIADENDGPSSSVCLYPIEQERKFLHEKIMKVETESVPKRFQIDFCNSMVDEKLQREEGLQGSGSKYMCTLCFATKETCKSELGSFNITRTYEGTKQIANPDQLSQNTQDELAQGVRQAPIVKSGANKIPLDARHADINIGRFLKNIISREIAQVTSWTLTKDSKELVMSAEKRFDQHLNASIGVNPALMMPGNYAPVLFDESNEKHLLYLIPPERRDALKALMKNFRFMRRVYCANSPKATYAEDVAKYKEVAVEFGRILLDQFSYADWPSYVHMVIEHTQELIQSPDGPGTVGGLSVGNEAGNRVFRQFCKDLSSKAGAKASLTEVIKLHWLYSSPVLRKLAKVEHARKRCTVCCQQGHNARQHKGSEESEEDL